MLLAFFLTACLWARIPALPAIAVRQDPGEITTISLISSNNVLVGSFGLGDEGSLSLVIVTNCLNTLFNAASYPASDDDIVDSNTNPSGDMPLGKGYKEHFTFQLYSYVVMTAMGLGVDNQTFGLLDGGQDVLLPADGIFGLAH